MRTAQETLPKHDFWYFFVIKLGIYSSYTGSEQPPPFDSEIFPENECDAYSENVAALGQHLKIRLNFLFMFDGVMDVIFQNY